MLGLYPNNMKAICSRGIQEHMRPEEINKKTEHNDKASYITSLSLLAVLEPGCAWIVYLSAHQLILYKGLATKWTH